MSSINDVTRDDMNERIVRFGDLRPCTSAFIDAHTPGSDSKENFCIIGGGVSESPDQYVHIRDTPGFNIGAAGQPPRCRNSLHAHTTAEVFFVHSGRWRFFWGLHGTAGEVVLERGDLFDIPTGVFRGFENVGTDYGVIMSILGGDDAGGGVTWAPHVIEEAREHGLVLAASGRLYDTARGEQLAPGEQQMPLLGEAQLREYPELPVSEVVPRFIARALDIHARSVTEPAKVLGRQQDALIRDRTGFEVDYVRRGSLPDSAYTLAAHEVLMVLHGYWRLAWPAGDVVLAPGDTCAVPPGLERRLAPTMTGDCGLFRVRATGDAAGPTRV